MFYNRTFHQERYQGARKVSPYFEGWYFRVVTQGGRTISFIPGISKSDTDSHCFIQMIDSVGFSRYFRYPLSAFEYSVNDFYIKIGGNTFSADGFCLEIKNDIAVSGKVTFKNVIPYPKSIICPGIMGPFSFVPFLECRHEVLYAKCNLDGQISINGDNVQLNGGFGYVEKDWGSSFPSPYIWAQSCCFEGSDASFMLSAARVPVFGKQLKGLIAFLYLDGKFYRFTTYNGAKVKEISYDHDVNLVIKMKNYKFEICLVPDAGQTLKAPIDGEMSGEIIESVCGCIKLKLHEGEKTIFCSQGQCAAIEICGNVLKLK